MAPGLPFREYVNPAALGPDEVAQVWVGGRDGQIEREGRRGSEAVGEADVARGSVVALRPERPGGDSQLVIGWMEGHSGDLQCGQPDLNLIAIMTVNAHKLIHHLDGVHRRHPGRGTEQPGHILGRRLTPQECHERVGVQDHRSRLPDPSEERSAARIASAESRLRRGREPFNATGTSAGIGRTTM